MAIASDFLERTLEDIIFENRNVIQERGFPKFKEKVFRQVILPSGKKIDILSLQIKNGHLEFDVFELKRETININTACQAYYYVEEISRLVANEFVSCKPSIVLVGKYYENIPLLKELKIPISVYTYSYHMDGISFTRCPEYEIFQPNPTFSKAIWAWGSGMIYYPNGQGNTFSFQNSYNALSSDVLNWIKVKQDLSFSARSIEDSPKIIEKEVYVFPKTVRTEIFPEQPQWSAEFRSGIEYNDDFIDDLELDESDYEPEEEEDCSDYEPDWEEEENEQPIHPFDLRNEIIQNREI